MGKAHAELPERLRQCIRSLKKAFVAAYLDGCCPFPAPVPGDRVGHGPPLPIPRRGIARLAGFAGIVVGRLLVGVPIGVAMAGGILVVSGI